MFNTTFNQLCQTTPSAPMPPATEGSSISAPGQEHSHIPPPKRPCVNLPPTLASSALSTKPLNVPLRCAFQPDHADKHDSFCDDMPKLKYVLRGIKLEEAKKGSPAPGRLPMTPAILLQLQSILMHHPSEFNNIMIWAAFMLCFFGFLRAGEITIPKLHSYDPSVHLNFSDIATDNLLPPNIMQVNIKASKTDPFRHGMSVYIGRTGTSLCPVMALLNYLTIRGSNPGLLFHFKDGTPLTKPRFTSNLRDLLKQAGINDTQYAGHSFSCDVTYLGQELPFYSPV